MDRFFPAPITNLPQADVPLEGLSAYLSQGVDHQILFMTFEKDAVLPEHAHGPQVGFVLKGRIDLQINGEETNFETGDVYYIPDGVPHSAMIHAGYADITFFGEADRYSTT
jgi:quercetin dioxygenase-like cupin family protein